MALWRALRPIVALFLAERRFALLSGALLAAATVLAGIALLGLSGWFITATAIAGLSSALALAFDVFAPAAAIRFLALTRTAARYGERLTTHDATLSVLAGLREQLFRDWARPEAARMLSEATRKTAVSPDSRYRCPRLALPACFGPCRSCALHGAGRCCCAWADASAIGVWRGVVASVGGIGHTACCRSLAKAPSRRRSHALEMPPFTYDRPRGRTDRSGHDRAACRAAECGKSGRSSTVGGG